MCLLPFFAIFAIPTTSVMEMMIKEIYQMYSGTADFLNPNVCLFITKKDFFLFLSVFFSFSGENKNLKKAVSTDATVAD
jgi:hypothetical protein